MNNDIIVDIGLSNDNIISDVVVDNRVVTEVIEKEVEKIKYGVSIDNILGNVNENGWLYKPTTPFVLDLAGVKRILFGAFYYKFYGDENITGADFRTVEEIDSTGLQYAFYGCENLTYANFAVLESINSSGLHSAFRDTGLTTLSFPALKIIRLAGFENGVRDCTALTSIYFSALETAEQGAFRYAFQGTALTSISFPALKNVNIGAFQQSATSTTSAAFRNVSTLTEIHFRADAKAAIEATYGYSSQWGATNATIYFDL